MKRPKTKRNTLHAATSGFPGKTELSMRKVRSAVTNGERILRDVDHRSAWMRRLRDLIVAHISDLGGDSEISNAQMLLIRRAAMMALQLELMESNWAKHDGMASAAQLNDYQRTASALRRILESIGLKRVARDITPTLETYALETEDA
jgi:inactivated superfamily I helicase